MVVGLDTPKNAYLENIISWIRMEVNNYSTLEGSFFLKSWMSTQITKAPKNAHVGNIISWIRMKVDNYCTFKRAFFLKDHIITQIIQAHCRSDGVIIKPTRFWCMITLHTFTTNTFDNILLILFSNVKDRLTPLNP